MASGKFRLYYEDGYAEFPCINVHYRITHNDALLLKGTTDQLGETTAVTNGKLGGSVKLEVYDWSRRCYASPDLFHDADSPVLDLGDADSQGVRIAKLRVKPYIQVRFHMHPGLVPIANAAYTGYALDANGRKAVAVSTYGKPVRGTTDKHGDTELIHCASPTTLKFTFPGTKIEVESRRFQPLIKGQQEFIYDVPFKTVTAQTAPNPDHQVHLAGKTSLPMVASLQDQELLMISQADFDEFEAFSGHLEQVLAAQHLARADLSRALESKSPDVIAAAEKALGLAEDKVKNELNKNFKQAADLKELITWESYNAGREQGNENAIGMRRRYIPKKKYEELKARKSTKEFKLAIKFPTPAPGTSGSASIKPSSLDVQALKASFEKVKTEIKSSKEWKADPKVFDFIDLAGNQLSDTIRKSDSYEVEQAAQWLRAVGGAGASAEASWKDKKVQLQGSLQGKLVLAEGQYTWRYAVPSLDGWLMHLGEEDLGAIRFVIECSVYGFAGAKIMACGTVGVALQGGKAIMKGVRRDPSTGYRNLIDQKTGLPKFEPTALNEAVPKDVTGAKVDLEAFAGVEAGLTPAGKIQWLPPQEKDFVSFAEASATVAVSAGAGLNAMLHIYYADGKFRLKVAAHVCWGVGAKGAIDFAVDADKLVKFVEWFYYQLLHMGFKQLVIINERAFQALSQILFTLVIDEKSDVGKALKADFIAVNTAFENLLDALDKAEKRKAMVSGINRKPHWLVFATPETRGMLLYQLTRHSVFSHAENLPSVQTGKHWNDPEVHYLPAHKDAILNVLRPVQTASEWDNVMQHMTMDGRKLVDGNTSVPRKASESPRSAGEAEGDVLRFLNDGLSLNGNLQALFDRINREGRAAKLEDTGNTYLDQYFALRLGLLNEFPKGYKVAENGTFGFEMLARVDGKQHPTFALADPAPLSSFEDDSNTRTA